MNKEKGELSRYHLQKVKITENLTLGYISVVIPVYKVQDCLHELYQRLKAFIEIIFEDFEIILVEDCGGDRFKIIVELAKKDPRIKGI
ncbi:MAG: glycosyltransferase [Nostoc sp.]|uniref:glycosyltransferase n=1 Tax=Nostoc sp. TaxID=1180 RepID=UPI002FF6013D